MGFRDMTSQNSQAHLARVHQRKLSAERQKDSAIARSSGVNTNALMSMRTVRRMLGTHLLVPRKRSQRW